MIENNVNINYLRFSLTDRCNLNCVYCTPLQKSQFLSHDEVLNYEEITRVVALFVKAGVRKLRLTGGEPLIKKNIIGLIKMLKIIDGLEEISMTTNGVWLKGLASRLKDAGLDRVNISINTLKKEKFRSITGFDYFDDVWAGINEALEVGLNPVKLNII
ncbi:MAG: radical SAM protein, partial [Bacteroidia bacterium]|nr:radical SAM protein [Bacteroidia bacterium]